MSKSAQHFCARIPLLGFPVDQVHVFWLGQPKDILILSLFEERFGGRLDLLCKPCGRGGFAA